MLCPGSTLASASPKMCGLCCDKSVLMSSFFLNMWLLPLFQYNVTNGFPLDGTLFPLIMWVSLFLSCLVIPVGCGAGSLLRGEWWEGRLDWLEGQGQLEGPDRAGMSRTAE